MKNLILMFSILFIFLIIPINIQALNDDTCTSTANSVSDLQNKLDSSNPGDVICLAAGDYTFNGRIDMRGGITLKGAGQANTIIRRSVVSDDYMLRISCPNKESFRLTDLTLYGSQEVSASRSYGSRGSAIDVGRHSQPCVDFRIDHVSIQKFAAFGINIRGDARGVVDQSYFSEISTYGVFVGGNTEQSWQRYPVERPGLGMAAGIDLNGDGLFETADAVYIENNRFEHTPWHHMASQGGSRYVFRYNTALDHFGGPQLIDAHGSYGPTSFWTRGSRSYESYNNILTLERTDPQTGKPFARHTGFRLRGGDGVVFNNIINGKGSISFPVWLENEQFVTGEGDCTNDGQNPENYPCLDQIRQLYFWNNTYKGGTPAIQVDHPFIIKQDREYFLLDNNPDFTFTSQNSWERKDKNAANPIDSLRYITSYTPFCYPHPLVSGVDCDPRNIISTPSLSLSATPSSIMQGKSSTLTWQTTNADSCTATGGWSGNKALSDSEKVYPATTTSYTLSCTGTEGTSSKSVTVKVTSPPISGSLAHSGTLISSSENFAFDHAVEHLWDSCLDGTEACTSGAGNIDSFWLEFDFSQSYDLTLARLFGDADGNWLSTAWQFQYKLKSQDSWITAFSNKNALFNDWSKQDLSVTARYVRVEVFGNPSVPATQARELEIFGTPTEGSEQENPGDINNDKTVNLLDILMIIKDFGKESGFDERSDIKKDNVINLLDILEVVKNWGKTY